MSGRSLLKEGECTTLIVLFFVPVIGFLAVVFSSCVKVLDLSVDWRWC